MSNRLSAVLSVICLAGFSLMGQSQEIGDETRSEVPELTAFHEVIYAIWHEAYPAKDAKALREWVPQINKLAAKVYTARLPGILREKENKWKLGVTQLEESVELRGQAAMQSAAYSD